jgi:hypothetical protein
MFEYVFKFLLKVFVVYVIMETCNRKKYSKKVMLVLVFEFFFMYGLFFG